MNGHFNYAVLCSVMSHSATPWTAARQAPLSMGILQARILEWIAVPFSRGSSQPRDWTQVSHIADGFFTDWATREARHFFLAVYMGCFILLRMIHAKVGWVWADVPLCTELNKVSLWKVWFALMWRGAREHEDGCDTRVCSVLRCSVPAWNAGR